MRNQACAPCAKRKVRCDREEPCSNCKRRKQDQCTYPDIPPTDRIKQLELLVRNLGGDPDDLLQDKIEASPAASNSNRQQQFNSTVITKPGNRTSPRANSSVILEEGGESIYLESHAGYSLPGNREGHHKNTRGRSHESDGSKTPAQAQTSSTALENIIRFDTSINFSSRHPSAQQAMMLWDAFDLSIKPFHRICFDWDLNYMRIACTSHEADKDFSPQEHAFLFALYLLTVGSFSEGQCLTSFNVSKTSKLSEFQMLCEQALARSEFLSSSDLLTIQALTLYIAAGLDKMSTRSLSSLMGLVIRNAERLGLHRDGTFFNLSPAETERRRRVWWHLQQMDMILAVKSGYGPLTLTSDWDTRLPLNIEDRDIDPYMKQFPEERQGITSSSCSLWLYWVVNEQLSFHRSDGTRPGIYWSSDRTLPQKSKDAMISRLETGLNQKFLQYCDPINPLDFLIQLLGRSFICGMRRLTLHSLVVNPATDSDRRAKLENDLLDICVRCLEYDVALHSTQSLRQFEWRTGEFFPWSAFAYVIIETGRRHNDPAVERLWNLLENMYTANSGLSDFSEDRRKSYAAELIVAAWKARQKSLREQHQRQGQASPQIWIPSVVVKLESLLAARNTTSMDSHEPVENEGREMGWSSNLYELRHKPRSTRQRLSQNGQSSGEQAPMSYFDLSAITDPVLSDIDWSFWESLPLVGP